MTMDIPPHLTPFARERTLADGTRIFLYDSGEAHKPALLLIHGLGDEADTWRGIIPELAARYRVIAPDLPGFGRSAHQRRAHTLGYFARAMGGLLDALGIARTTVAGSSLGAGVAQRLALWQPGRVERLVLIGGALPVGGGKTAVKTLLYLVPGVGELMYVRNRRSQDVAAAGLRPYYASFDALPNDDQSFLRQRVWARVWSAPQRRAFLSTVRWLAIDRSLRADSFRTRLAKLAVPTLLLWGEHDRIQSLERGSEMAALLPDARLEIIPGAGHLPQQEQPEAVARAILAEG